MKTTLVVLGTSLHINKAFLQYLYEHIALHVKEAQKIFFLDKNDNNLIFTLEGIIENSEQLLIAANEDAFNLVGKVLSTLSEDNLELKGNTLTPSKAKNFKEGSYLIEYKNAAINLILAKENKELPEILLTQEEESAQFSLIGLDEDTTKILLDPLAQSHEIKLTSSSLISGWSTLQAQTNKYGNLESFLEAAQSLFPEKFILGTDIPAHIVAALSGANKSVTVAESCTGGRLAAMLTEISGSSACFDGSVVSYSNSIKKAWLGVSDDTLKHHGAVSELCVREMLEGVLNASSADFAMATSGVAGPSGGSSEKPVGTVFVGARSKHGEVLVERLLLEGDRHYIQIQSCYHAMMLLLQVGKDIFFKK